MRFSLLGIPVHVRPAFWLVALVIARPSDFQEGRFDRIGTWVAIVFVSVLVHELGHAFAMRAVGRTPSIQLWGMGGLTQWGEGPRVSGWKRAAVSLAGPVAGFTLALPIALASHFLALEPGSLAEVAVGQALWVNVGWGALNLLPILPLDGGHILEVALTRVAGGERGPRLARYASLAFAAAGAVAAFVYEVPGAAFLALVAGLLALRGLDGPAGDGAIPARASVDPEVRRVVDDAWGAIHEGRCDDAVSACEAQLAALPDDEAHGPLRARVLETIAWAHIEADDEPEALATAARMPPGFAPSDLLAARLMLAEGKHEEGMRALERAFQDSPGELPGLVLAAAHLDARRPERAVAMLRTLRGARLGTAAHLTISASLFYAEHFEHALAVSELAWNRFRDSSHAYNAACSCARLGRVDEGLAWIREAVRAGFDDHAKLHSDDDLAPLRLDARWREAVGR